MSNQERVVRITEEDFQQMCLLENLSLDEYNVENGSMILIGDIVYQIVSNEVMPRNNS